MATVAELILQLNAVQSTPSGLVEWNNNSLQNVMYNGVKQLLLERGVMQVEDITALQLVGAGESNAVAIDGGGYYLWADNVIPNYVTSFPAAGGGAWVQQFVSTPVVALDDLTDVDITSPTNGQALQYDSASGKWINSNVGNSLANLSDVNLSFLSNGQPLVYDGFNWVNANGIFINTADGSLNIGSGAFLVESLTGNTSVAGNTNIAGNLNMVGDLLVNPGSGYTFTVDSANGDTTLGGILNVGNGINVNNSKFVVNAANGNTAIAGNLDMVGDLLINPGSGYTFTVDSANGDVYTNGNVGIAGDLNIANKIFGYGNTGNFSANQVFAANVVADVDVRVSTGYLKFGNKSTPGGTIRVLTNFSVGSYTPPTALPTRKFSVRDGNGNVIYLYGYAS